MNFIIFDLEWNNAYNYKLKRGMNEIIEIGAVKLDENLKVIDTFKQLIKPKLSKKLGSRFKNLTHITIDEINQSGISFENAFDNFSKWCGKGDNLFLSWSTSDLYTLVANFKEFENTVYVDFILRYADAQKYCMYFIENADSSNQISLSNCAEIFEIDTDCINFHRALEDCMITAYCFEKVYDADILQNFVHTCDISFLKDLYLSLFTLKMRNTTRLILMKLKLFVLFAKAKLNLLKSMNLPIIPLEVREFVKNAVKNFGHILELNKLMMI